MSDLRTMIGGFVLLCLVLALAVGGLVTFYGFSMKPECDGCVTQWLWYAGGLVLAVFWLIFLQSAYVFLCNKPKRKSK